MHREETMKALYLIPGLVCLLIGGTFLFLVRL